MPGVDKHILSSKDTFLWHIDPTKVGDQRYREMILRKAVEKAAAAGQASFDLYDCNEELLTHVAVSI